MNVIPWSSVYRMSVKRCVATFRWEICAHVSHPRNVCTYHNDRQPWNERSVKDLWHFKEPYPSSGLTQIELDHPDVLAVIARVGGGPPMASICVRAMGIFRRSEEFLMHTSTNELVKYITTEQDVEFSLGAWLFSEVINSVWERGTQDEVIKLALSDAGCMPLDILDKNGYILQGNIVRSPYLF
jgi:hypothetical protein